VDPLVERLADLLARAQGVLGLNQREFAISAGISEGQMSGLVTGHKALRKDTYERVRRVISPALIPELEDIYRMFQSGGEHQMLLHARDVAAVSDGSGKEVGAHLIGIITQRFKKADRLDWTLTDETGSVPIVVAQAILRTSFDAAKTKLRDARVEVKGFVGKNQRGSTGVIATSVTEPLSSNKTVPGGSQAASAIYIARLTEHFRGRLIAEGYVEIATRLLTSSWPVSGLYPLKALYDGFGQPFFIAPSPIPQLVKSLIETRYDKLFTVSRCFTQTYRDPTASVEATIVSTVTTQGSIESALSSCHRMVERLYLAAATAPRQERPSSLVIRREEWPPSRTPGVASPEVHLYDVPGADGTRLLGRLLWPQAQAAGEDFQEYVLAEGFSQASSGRSLTCFTINIERLLALLFAEVDIRRIPAITGGIDNDAKLI
jgi:hypothetical protein